MPMKIPVIITLVVVSIIAIVTLVLAAVLLANLSESHGREKAPTDSPVTPRVTTSGHPVPHGWLTVSELFSASVDRTQDPCQNFYAFACNNWIANHTDDTDWFTEGQHAVNQGAIRAIMVIDNSPDSKIDRALRSLKTLFDGCEKDIRNTSTRANKIDELLGEFGGWPILKPDWNWNHVPARFQDFSYTIGWLHSRYALPSLLIADTRADQFGAGRLQVFGPAVTLEVCVTNTSDPIWSNLRTLMEKTITRLAKALDIDIDQAILDKDVEDMVQVEQRICQISTNETPTIVSVPEAHSQWPNINWEKYLQALLVDVFGYENISAQVQSEFYIKSPDYISELDKTIFPEYTSSPQNVRIFQNYLLWRLVLEYVQYTLPIVQPELDHFVRSNRLRKRIRQKWHGLGVSGSDHRYVSRQYAMSGEQCLKMANDAATFAVGRAYVDYKYGSDVMAVRKQVLDDMNAVMNEFRNMLQGLTWMDDQSKKNAMEKIDYMIVNAVNQDWAFDDDRLDQYYAYMNQVIVDPGFVDVFDMALAIQQYQLGSRFRQIGMNGTDRTTWGEEEYSIGPLTVNAWYLLDHNSITVPAGILRSPFYRHDFPYATNFGALGSILGHELTHGFDAQGQVYDKYGLKDDIWISYESWRGFKKMANCVDDQYSHFCYNFSGTMECLNPGNTEEENLADNGGMRAAYGAYMATRPHFEPPIPGFEDLSMEQVFFLSFAEQWCERLSQGILLQRLLTSTHSPSRDRVIGTLQNFPPFAKAWKCAKGDFMYPENSCHVW